MCLILDQFLWGHSSRVCDISCFHAFLCSADIFQNSLSQIIISVSNSLDPDQAQCSSGPDLGPNCKDHQQMTKFAAGSLSLGF